VLQQLRQLGDVYGDTPRLIAGEQVRRRAPPRLLLEIDVGQRFSVVILRKLLRQLLCEVSSQILR
jgi:hypothetical protein